MAPRSILLIDLPDIGSFADDYTRCDITQATELAAMSVDDVVFLGIGGIGDKKAAQHIAAAKNAIENTPTRAKKKATKMKESKDSLSGHRGFDYLDAKQADRVKKFAAVNDAVVDPVAWFDHVVLRCELMGDPEHELAKFVRNLELRLV